MLKTGERLEEIDYLRGFAILAVLTIHTSAYFTHIPNINLLLVVNLIIDVFSGFAVPLFVFISGFVLSLNYNGLFSQKLFYKKRAESILPQYIIFSTLYILLKITLTAINGETELPSITKIVFYLLTGASSYHLWYFVLIIQFYILYPYFIRTYEGFESKNKALSLLFFCLFFQLIWIIIRDIAQTYYTSVISSMLKRVFLSQIFYFTLGIYVNRNYNGVKSRISRFKYGALTAISLFTGIISAFWIAGIMEYGNYYSIPRYYFIIPEIIGSVYFPLIFSMILMASLNLLNSKNKYSKIILSIGKYSFGIYLIHVLYVSIIVERVYPLLGIDFEQLVFYPVLFILTLFLSYFSVYLLTNLPYSEMIVGVKNNRKLAKQEL